MERRVHDCLSPEILSEQCIYSITDASRCDYPWGQAETRWHSVNAHHPDAAGNVALSLFPIKAANTEIMHSNDQFASELPDSQDESSLTLCRHSYSEWGRQSVTLSFPEKASQYHFYEWPQPIATQITNDARPKIFEGTLTLIFSIGQGAGGSLCCLKSQPIPHSWMAATYCDSD